MMNTYDDNKAAEIAALFNIPNGTVNVWKTRGVIPKKFLNADGTVVSYLDQSPPINEVQKEALVKLFDLKFLEHKSIKSIDSTKIYEFKRGRTTITQNEYNQLRNELLKLKDDFRKVLQYHNYDAKRRALKIFFELSIIKPYLLHDNTVVYRILKDSEVDREKIDVCVLDIQANLAKIIL